MSMPLVRSSALVQLIVCGLLMFPAFESFGDKLEKKSIGKKIATLSLRDYRGKQHSLNNWSKKRLLVVVFLGNDCPLAQLYGPRLQSLSDEFESKGVGFVGVNSNRQDTLGQMAAYAKRQGCAFPILKDPNNKVADQFGAERTPEAFLLDQDRVIRYQGRIDDQYLVGAQRSKPKRRDLAIAIEELLRGESVTVATREAPGCIISRVPTVTPTGDITFSSHIANIINRHCAECHREGEIGPFPLTSYEETACWAETIREVVSDGRMPPWFADPAHGDFSNDISLSKTEKETLLTWIDNGSPEGAPDKLPPAAHFVKGWRIGKPDSVYHIPQPFSVSAEGTVDYQYFMVDPKLEKDAWISHAEARPDNSKVVHHIVIYAVPGKFRASLEKMLKQDDTTPNGRLGGQAGGIAGAFGQMVAIYAPGMPAWVYPNGTGMKIQKDSLLVFQMHYTPNGTVQEDQSYVGFKFVPEETVQKRIRYGMAVNVALQIPPNEPNHQAVARFRFNKDTLLLSLFPHMHYRGKSFSIEAVYPDKSREMLLAVPRYDFNWQLRYDLAKPKLLPGGTVLHCVSAFDNSAANPLNPDPSKTVRFGLQSWQEMMVGYFTFVPANEDLLSGDDKQKSGTCSAP